jgi:hypothetical protein
MVAAKTAKKIATGASMTGSAIARCQTFTSTPIVD